MVGAQKALLRVSPALSASGHVIASAQWIPSGENATERIPAFKKAL